MDSTQMKANGFVNGVADSKVRILNGKFCQNADIERKFGGLIAYVELLSDLCGNDDSVVNRIMSNFIRDASQTTGDYLKRQHNDPIYHSQVNQFFKTTSNRVCKNMSSNSIETMVNDASFQRAKNALNYNAGGNLNFDKQFKRQQGQRLKAEQGQERQEQRQDQSIQSAPKLNVNSNSNQANPSHDQASWISPPPSLEPQQQQQGQQQGQQQEQRGGQRQEAPKVSAVSAPRAQGNGSPRTQSLNTMVLNGTQRHAQARLSNSANLPSFGSLPPFGSFNTSTSPNKDNTAFAFGWSPDGPNSNSNSNLNFSSNSNSNSISNSKVPSGRHVFGLDLPNFGSGGFDSTYSQIAFGTNPNDNSNDHNGNGNNNNNDNDNDNSRPNGRNGGFTNGGFTNSGFTNTSDASGGIGDDGFFFPGFSFGSAPRAGGVSNSRDSPASASVGTSQSKDDGIIQSFLNRDFVPRTLAGALSQAGLAFRPSNFAPPNVNGNGNGSSNSGVFSFGSSGFAPPKPGSNTNQFRR